MIRNISLSVKPKEAVSLKSKEAAAKRNADIAGVMVPPKVEFMALRATQMRDRSSSKENVIRVRKVFMGSKTPTRNKSSRKLR